MRALFWALAGAFAVTALFHLAQAAHLVGDGTHAARHALFASIDALVAVLMLRRPTGFPAVFAVLVGQQLASHGGDLLRTWGAERRIDPSDVAVVVVMPLALALLVVGARSRQKAAEAVTRQARAR